MITAGPATRIRAAPSKTAPRHFRRVEPHHAVAAPALRAEEADGLGGERRQRRLERRRQVREQIVVAAVLLVALAVTLVLLGMQWLDSTASTTSSASASIFTLNLGGSG